MGERNYLQNNSCTKRNVTRNGELVQLEHVRCSLEALQVVRYLTMVVRIRNMIDSFVSITLRKLSPSLTRGTVGKTRAGFITSSPRVREYKLDCTTNKSEVDLTGRKRERGTLTPLAFWKYWMAAPAAISSWRMAFPSTDLGLTMMSMSSRRSSLRTRSMAFKFNQRLLVLKILNFLMDLNSSTYCTLEQARQ